MLMEGHLASYIKEHPHLLSFPALRVLRKNHLPQLGRLSSAPYSDNHAEDTDLLGLTDLGWIQP